MHLLWVKTPFEETRSHFKNLFTAKAQSRKVEALDDKHVEINMFSLRLRTFSIKKYF
jgi:hypothetical protein